PGRTQVDFQAETVARLSRVDNIVGIKEATPHIERVGRYLADSKQGFAVYCGEDPLAADYILAGAKGNISVTANVAPKAMAEMCAQALAGNEAALAQNQQLAELHSAMFLESSPIPVKWALSAMDKIDLGIRLPLTVLSEHHQLTVSQALKNAGLVHA
ncbi:MAG: dihydrodipicolinate synthase family protein, partial [Pseudomonadota bacterium]|nr:dihydrodipicolinate synthase family protein [Pseudomonadota bacterium]